MKYTFHHKTTPESYFFRRQLTRATIVRVRNFRNSLLSRNSFLYDDITVKNRHQSSIVTAQSGDTTFLTTLFAETLFAMIAPAIVNNGSETR